MERRTFVLQNDFVRHLAIEAIRTAPEGMTVTIKPATRTLEQNSLLWPLLTAVSQQVDWYGHKLTPDEWKDVFTAALNFEQRQRREDDSIGRVNPTPQRPTRTRHAGHARQRPARR